MVKKIRKKQMEKLPICPCGSNELYENCCYLKKDSFGKPLFFRDAMFSNDAGKNWHPQPNIQHLTRLVGKEKDKFREKIKDFITINKVSLTDKQKEKFINDFALFLKSSDDLINTLKKGAGKGVAFQIDSLEVRQAWSGFLMNGRMLIDLIGIYAEHRFNLSLSLGGINYKTYEKLINLLKEKGKEDIVRDLERLKTKIIDFIAVRDTEKIQQDTILEFPIVDENGEIIGGKISFKNRGDIKSFDMGSFVIESHKSIFELSMLLLGIKKKLSTAETTHF